MLDSKGRTELCQHHSLNLSPQKVSSLNFPDCCTCSCTNTSTIVSMHFQHLTCHFYSEQSHLLLTSLNACSHVFNLSSAYFNTVEYIIWVLFKVFPKSTLLQCYESSEIAVATSFIQRLTA